MWKNQRGFSLVEAIITIAIIGILAGSSVAMVGHIRYANTKKVAEEVDTALSRLRLDTMTKMGEDKFKYLYIYRWSDGLADGYSDGYYVRLLDEDEIPSFDSNANLNSGNGTRLCGTNVVFIKDNGQTVGKGDYICIAYKKNGLFRFVDEDGNVVTNTKSITISGSGTYEIILNEETGRHYFK